MKKFIFVLAAFTFILAGAGSSYGALRVGVKDYIVGFSHYSQTSDQYYGLEIDLARLLCTKLGEEAEFIGVTPDNCEEMLDEGKIDLLIAAYSWTELRASQRDFSPSYYQDHAAAMVARSSLYSDITDLMGKRIGVIHGSDAWFVFGSYFYERGLIDGTDQESVNKYFDIVKVDEIDDLYHRLETGEVDAVVSDRVILRTYFDEDKYMIFDEDLSSEDYCVVTPQGSALSAPVYEAVEELLDDGTIDQLIEKWS